MTFYHLLTLMLAHDYFDGPPPLAARLTDPRRLQRQGILAKPRGAGMMLAIETDAARPDRISFDIWSTDAALLHVSPVQVVETVPEVDIDAKAGTGERRLSPAEFGTSATDNGPRALSRLHINLPRDGTPELRVVFPAVETIWAYHILGRAEETLSIVDSSGEVRFDSDGPTSLSDGRTARTYRADRTLGLRARSMARFSLMHDGPFGAQTLIETLPTARAITSYTKGTDPTPKLQSDIYVTL